MKKSYIVDSTCSNMRVDIKKKDKSKETPKTEDKQTTA